MNVQVRVYLLYLWGIHLLRTLIAHPLVRMHQKEKIAVEIAAKISSVNGPLGRD